MSYTPEQFNKLPKWAQSEMSKLQRNEEYWKQECRIVSAKESDVSIRYPGDMDERVFVPSGVSIKFQVGSHWVDYIEVRLKEDYNINNQSIKVLHVSGASGFLHVRPQSSNVVDIFQDYPVLRK